MVEAQKKEQDTTRQTGLRVGSARVRTCIGCGERVEIARAGASSALVRLVLGPNNEVAVDAAGSGFGRGAHVHPRPACIEKAVTKGLARAARAKVGFLWSDEPQASGQTEPGLVPLDAGSLSRVIVRALDRRVQGLVVAAARSRKLAPGTDAVNSADERGEALLIVVATDAAAGQKLSVVLRAIAEGRAVAWGTKQSLGALCSAADSAKRTEGLAVVAIKDDRLAAAIREAAVAASGLLAAPTNLGLGRSGQGRRADG